MVQLPGLALGICQGGYFLQLFPGGLQRGQPELLGKPADLFGALRHLGGEGKFGVIRVAEQPGLFLPEPEDPLHQGRIVLFAGGSPGDESAVKLFAQRPGLGELHESHVDRRVQGQEPGPGHRVRFPRGILARVGMGQHFLRRSRQPVHVRFVGQREPEFLGGVQDIVGEFSGELRKLLGDLVEARLFLSGQRYARELRRKYPFFYRAFLAGVEFFPFRPVPYSGQLRVQSRGLVYLQAQGHYLRLGGLVGVPQGRLIAHHVKMADRGPDLGEPVLQRVQLFYDRAPGSRPGIGLYRGQPRLHGRRHLVHGLAYMLRPDLVVFGQNRVRKQGVHFNSP